MSKIYLLKRLQVFDKHPRDGGEMVYDSGESECRSWVTAFLKHIEAGSRDVAVSATDINDAARGMAAPSDVASGRTWMSIIGVESEADNGTVIGTGTTTETNTDTKLETRITDGATSGKMEYDEHTYTTTAVVSTNVDFVWNRTFTNNSGASISVTEIGLYCESYRTAQQIAVDMCLAREVVTSTAVADGQTLLVKFTMRTTV